MNELKAVIQAGGQGTRLAPYSTVLPKALMPIGDGTVIDHLLSQFRDAGVSDVFITVSKFGPLIRSYCGDGSRWDLEIDYVTEDAPLGTIGGLNLLRDRLDGPFFVANSDVYTDLELKDLLAAHSERPGRRHRGRDPADGEHRLRGARPRQRAAHRVPGEADPGVLGEHRDLLHESGGLRVHPADRARSGSIT